MSQNQIGPAQAAVYYPHSHIRDEEFLKYALVFWDNVQVISPGHLREPTRRSSELQEAAEIVEVEVMPSYDVKARVERRIEELLADGAERWLGSTLPNDFHFMYRDRFPIHFEKFSEKTWELLYERGLAANRGHPRGPETGPVLGLFLMSVLADEIAGRTRHRITDRIQPYAWINNLLAKESGGEVLDGRKVLEKPESYRVLTTVEVPLLNVQRIPLDRLVALRRMEQKDPAMRGLRASYVRLISEYVEALQGDGLTNQDVRNLSADFGDRYLGMMRELKRALALADSDAKLDDKVLAGIWAAATAIVGGVAYISDNYQLAATSAISGLTAIEKVAGVLRVRRTHAEATRKALKESPISWGYLAGSHRG